MQPVASPAHPAHPHPGPLRPVSVGLTRWGLVASGAACIIIAGLVDLEFVETYFSEDGHVEPKNAAALQIVRLGLATLGTSQIAAAIAMPWFGPALTSFFGSPRRARWAVFTTPLLILTLLYSYKLAAGLDDRIYWIVTREDGIIEWATALMFFASAAILAFLANRAGRVTGWFRLYYAVFSLFCLFVALEEISYGQRIVGFDTPSSLSAMNTQEEANIHNIEWLGLISFYIGPLCLGVFGSLGCLLPWLRQLLNGRMMILLGLMFPPWYLSTWYVPYALFALYDLLAWGSLPLIEWQDSEVLEALVAFGILAFAWHVRTGLRHLIESPLVSAFDHPKEMRCHG